ncbi:MAG: 6-pyruvoyl trahydropterin synthase family protein [Planctomycetota bacterium]
MFTVSVETRFWASHGLVLPDGSKEQRHQHNWMVAAEVSSTKLDDRGLVMDFRRLKAMVDGIVADFDNLELDKLDCFQRNNTSAENVAKHIYERLQSKLPKHLELKQITVVEEPGYAAKFAK